MIFATFSLDVFKWREIYQNQAVPRPLLLGRGLGVPEGTRSTRWVFSNGIRIKNPGAGKALPWHRQRPAPDGRRDTHELAVLLTRKSLKCEDQILLWTPSSYIIHAVDTPQASAGPLDLSAPCWLLCGSHQGMCALPRPGGIRSTITDHQPRLYQCSQS